MVLKHHFTVRKHSKTTWTTHYLRWSTKGRLGSNKTKKSFNLQMTIKKGPLEAGGQGGQLPTTTTFAENRVKLVNYRQNLLKFWFLTPQFWVLTPTFQ